MERKNTDGAHRLCDIIRHSDGHDYFLFDEDLYGYSVLDLQTLESMHYIPSESYGKAPKETFIWCGCHYNAKTDMLAVDGCCWADNEDVIVLHFQNPMIPVEAENWHTVSKAFPPVDALEFAAWEGEKLICSLDDDQRKTICIDGGTVTSV